MDVPKWVGHKFVDVNFFFERLQSFELKRKKKQTPIRKGATKRASEKEADKNRTT